MTLHLGDTAPDFTVETQNGEISLHDWAGDSWVFLFSRPADFTPVTAQLADEFAARNVKPLDLSTDTAEEHRKWIEDVNDTQSTTLRSRMTRRASCFRKAGPSIGPTCGSSKSTETRRRPVRGVSGDAHPESGARRHAGEHGRTAS